MLSLELGTWKTKEPYWILKLTLRRMFLAFSGIFTFLVDAYPLYAASALAANTFARCMFAASFPLFGDQSEYSTYHCSIRLDSDANQQCIRNSDINGPVRCWLFWLWAWCRSRKSPSGIENCLTIEAWLIRTVTFSSVMGRCWGRGASLLSLNLEFSRNPHVWSLQFGPEVGGKGR